MPTYTVRTTTTNITAPEVETITRPLCQHAAEDVALQRESGRLVQVQDEMARMAELVETGKRRERKRGDVRKGDGKEALARLKRLLGKLRRVGKLGRGG